MNKTLRLAVSTALIASIGSASLSAKTIKCAGKRAEDAKAVSLLNVYLKNRIKPGMSIRITGVKERSPLDGFCEVDYAVYDEKGRQVSATIPAFFDGERLVVGDVITANGSYVDKRAYALNAERLEKIRKELTKKAERRKRVLSPILKKSAKKAIAGEWKEASIFIEGKNPNGKVYVIYTDPQCPYCVKMEKNVLPKLLEKAKGVVLVDFPLPFHKQARLRSWYRHYAVYGKNEDPMKAVHEASVLPYEEIKKRLKEWNAETPSEKWENAVKSVKKSSGVRFTPTISTVEDGLLYPNEALEKTERRRK